MHIKIMSMHSGVHAPPPKRLSHVLVHLFVTSELIIFSKHLASNESIPWSPCIEIFKFALRSKLPITTELVFHSI